MQPYDQVMESILSGCAKFSLNKYVFRNIARFSMTIDTRNNHLNSILIKTIRGLDAVLEKVHLIINC